MFFRFLLFKSGFYELDEKRMRAFGATVVVQSFPIGIDVDEFEALTQYDERRRKASEEAMQALSDLSSDLKLEP